MQSSAFVGLRVVVLLTGLIGLPLIAMVGAPSRQSTTAGTGDLASPQMPPPAAEADRVEVSPPSVAPAVAPNRSIGPPPSAPVAEKSTLAAPPPPAGRVEQDVHMVAIQRRLRQLGATYYSLEKWGVEGELYRFHCRIAIGEGGSANRHFEATDADAQVAMQRVLAEVEAWRATH